MASTLSGSGAATPPVRKAGWKAEGVVLKDVLEHLDSTHRELAGRRLRRGGEEHPRARSSVMNLVALVPSHDSVEHAREVARGVGSRHPCRVVVIEVDTDSDRMDAEIESEAGEGGDGGAPTQFEQVFLRVGAEAVAQLPSLVEPFLLPDVRTHLWWLGAPPREEADLHGALEFADTLVVDSAGFERPFTSFIDLATLARAICDRVAVNDLQWSRLVPWRAALTGFFGPSDRRPLLEGINGIGIDYLGEHRANRTGVALLAGWLGSALGWRLKHAVGGQGGIVSVYYDSAKGAPVEVASRSVSREDFDPGAEMHEGEVTALRIEAAARGRVCHVVIERDRENPHRASMRAEIGDDVVASSMPLTTLGDPDQLSRAMVMGRRDAVFLRSLYAGAETLTAFR